MKHITKRSNDAAYGLDQSSDISGPAEAMDEIDHVKPTLVALSSGLPNTITYDAASSVVEKTTGSAIPPLSRTKTQTTRHAVFGKQDEVLFNIDDEEHPEVVPVKRNLRVGAGVLGGGNKRSSITVVTSPPSKENIPDSDNEMDALIVLKAPSGRTAGKKNVVIDSETEGDDVDVLKNIARGQHSLQSGRRTRASKALADHEIVAAAATNKSIPSAGNQMVATSTKQAKRNGRATTDKRQAALAFKNTGDASGHAPKRRLSLAAAEVALPVSDDFHLLPIAQSVQAPDPSKLSALSAIQNVFSGLYASDRVAPEAEHVDKSAQIGLHLLLLWPRFCYDLECC